MAFDNQRPPSSEQIDDCVHCGFCLPACPTYALWGNEADSPRGRIYLMRLGLENRAVLVTAWPSGVKYDELIESTRAQVERQAGRSIVDRLFRRSIFWFFPHPGRLRVVALMLWIYQQLGIQRLFRAIKLLNILPARLRAMETMAPAVDPSAFYNRLPEWIPAQGEKRKKVALMLGCEQRTFFSDVNEATARVLSAEGCEVVCPQQQGCCGALMVHAGLEDEAILMAKKFVDTFSELDVDTIVINAAGCGSTLKDYGRLLRDEPAYAARAKTLAGKCQDISELLASLPPRSRRYPVPLNIVYHDACHLLHAQGISAEPRQVLEMIPDLKVKEIPDGNLCCGSAGIYNLVEPEAANDLGERKISNILSTGAEAVVSSNPGCLLQLQSNLKRTNKQQEIPMLHLVQIVDCSIRNEWKELM